ncbi:MAG: Lrp/AsnC family transcriptional regulator [Clostridiaceae bacterium]|nr:Lrp/AsnC family transcriptional regulator [Clostridiaceae bacterium]
MRSYMEKRNAILQLLFSQRRLETSDMARMLDMSEEEVQKEIDQLEKDHVIMGYSAMIDWTKTPFESVKAMIEVSTTPQRDRGFGRIARRIYSYPEVKDCYLVSGDYDLMVIVVSKNLQSVAQFVSEKIAPIDGVLSTRTHFILQNYKVNGVTFSVDESDDRETVVL